MRTAFRRRSVPATPRLLTWLGASAVCTVLVLTGVLASANPPPASNAAPLSEAERKKLLTERDRYDKQSTDLDAQQKYAEAIAVAEKMLALERRVFGNVAEDVAGSLVRIGRYHLERDEFALARKAFEENHSINSKLYGERDWRVTNARLELLTVDMQVRLTAEQRRELVEAKRAMSQVLVLDRKGEFAKAVPFATRVLDIRLRLLGPERPETAKSCDWLGHLYLSTSKYLDAELYYRRALAIREKVLGDEHPDTKDARGKLADSLSRLAERQTEQENFAPAQIARKEALALRIKQYGETDWRVTDARQALQDLDIRSRLTAAERRELITAEQADAQAAALDDKGEFRQAVRFAEQAAKIRRRFLGDQHPDTATSLNHLALPYKSLGDYAKAEPLFRQALEIRKKVLGENHPVTAASLGNLARMYESLGDYANAEPLLRQALEIHKKTLGENDPGTAPDLSNLAGLYESLGNYAKAKPLRLQALEIDKKALGETHPAYATDLNNLALLYESLGDYAKAEPLLRQALEINKKVLGENHPETAANLGNLAELYESLADYAKAELLLRQALEINKNVLGEKHPGYATNLNNLARLYKSRGDYAKAEPLYRQALEIHKKALGEKHPRTATSLNNLALLYYSLGDDTKAEPLLRQALEIRKKVLGENHPVTAVNLGNLAQLYKSREDYAKAEPLYRQALEINQKVLGENHPLTGVSLGNLAELYQLRGDYAKAKPLRLQAMEIRKKTLGEKHPDAAKDLNNLAMLYKSLGDYAKAEPLYLQALEISKKALGENHPDTATSLNNLALLYEAMGDYAKAEPLCRQALEISLDGLSHNFGILSERQQLALESSSSGVLSNYLSLASAAGIGDGATYAYVLESKGAVTARQSFVRLERRRPDLKPLFDELQTVGTRLANLSLAGADPKHPEVRQQKIEALIEQKELLEGKLAGQYHGFAQTRDAARLGREEQLKKLRAAIPPQTALVDVLEYWYVVPPAAKNGPQKFERRLVAFVVRSDANVRKIDLGPVASIARLVDSWRHTYGRPGASNPGSFLRARIWKRLEPALAGAETILFSPDGPLCRFPLAALPGSKPGSYLIEERNIVVIPVPQLLPQLLASAPSANGPASTPLLIGDVDFGSEPGIVSLAQSDVGRAVEHSRSAVRGEANVIFSPLPGTAHEIEGICSLYRQQFAGREPQSISGSKATEQAFRTEAARHRWIHVATHGFFAPETVASAPNRATGEKQPPGTLLSETANNVRESEPGLLSGIALAGANRKSGPDNGPAPGANQEPDDGIMTALEVEGLDLADVDLVVLSACETGLGKSAGGEGVLGLQRAFQLAGAKTCVTSLWKVDDSATQMLMQEFYGNLWGIDPATKKPRKKLGKLEALKQAQLKMLRDYDPGQKKLRGLDLPADAANSPERGSPFYWAAFVLSGEWGALSNAERTKLMTERNRLWQDAKRLRGEGKLNEAIPAARQVLAIQRELFGSASIGVAQSLEWLAEAHLKRDEFDAARTALQEASEIRTKVYGENNWRAADARRALRDVDIRSRLTVAERRELDTAKQVNAQVVALYRKGDFRSAIRFAEQVANMRRRLLGEQHPDTAVSLNNLAELYRSLGDYAKAEPLFQQALEIDKKALGDEHPDTKDVRGKLIESLSRLAERQSQQENFAPAQIVWKEAVALQIKQYGEKDWRVTDSRQALRDVEIRSHLTVAERRELDTAEQQNSQAIALSRKGDFRQAVRFAERAAQIRRRLLSDQHPDTAASINNLATLYNSLKEYAKAEPLYRQALEIRQKVLGDHHPRTAASLGNLAQMYGSLGDYAKAEPLCRQALAIRERVLGDEHPDTKATRGRLADCLSRLAERQTEQENFAPAQVARKEALALRIKQYGETDWRVTDARQALQDLDIRSRLTAAERRELITAEQADAQAAALDDKGEFRQAVRFAEQAANMRRRLLGDQHPDTATSLNQLALSYHSLADYTKAERLFRQALEIDKKALGETHPAYATGLNNLALLYQSRADHAQAEPLLRQALEINKKALGENHPHTAATLNNLSQMYQALGDYTKAEPLARQALEIHKRVLGENHPSTAGTLSNLALLYYSRGDYTKAEPLDRQALEIRKNVLGDQHPSTAQSLNNLALLYYSLGDDAKAEHLYRQALEIRKKVLGENHPDTATSLNNLAELYRSQGDYAKAEPLYRQALEINKKVLGENHPDTAMDLSNLALLYQALGNDAKAEPLLGQALEINKKARGENHPFTAASLDNLAGLYEALGDYAKAEPLYRQALEIQKKVLGENHHDTAASLNSLAGLYEALGDYAKAEQLCRQALEISLGGLSHNFGILSERQQLALELNSVGSLSRYLSLASAAGIDDGAVYAYVLESKGAVTARQSLVRLERRRPDLKHLFDELQTVGTRLANLSLAGADPKHPEVRLQKIEALTEQKELLEGKLAGQYRDFAQTRDAARLGREEQVKKLRAAIPPHTALVDMLEYWPVAPLSAKKGPLKIERRLVAFVVRSDANVRKIDLGPVAPIATSIGNWRQTYGRPGASNPGSDLRARVWKPLEPALAGAETILFSPDGPLCRFPLAALPGSKPGSYLIEERNIVVIPVPRLMPQLLASAGIPSVDSPASTPLLIGDVDFGSQPGIVSLAQSDVGRAVARSRSAVRGEANIVFALLPGTAQEIEGIRSLYRQQFAGREPQSISGSKATEQAFRTEAPRHRSIHVATHGFFAPETALSALGRAKGDKQPPGALLSDTVINVRGIQPGLLSGIALAGANRKSGAEASATSGIDKEPDDGILTALEVEGLDLADVDLVVLSACETGLGKSAGGEGVLGLQRAFQLAGAKTCVTSLWKVDDTATQMLMQEFYGNLWGIDPTTKKPRKKLGKLEALKQAQLKMLHDYDPGQKKLRGLDLPAEAANLPQRGSPFYWAAFVLSGDWR